MKRTLEFHALDEALADVDRLLRDGYTRQGDWNLAQICAHLTDAFNRSIDGFNYAIPWAVRRIFGPIVLRKVLRIRQLPPGFQLPQEQVPPAGPDAHECAAKLRRSIERFERHDGPMAAHPFFGPISHDTWRRLHLIHAAHHLGFLVPHDSLGREAARRGAGMSR